MSKLSNLILLGILGITDAWMIAHPNLMGRAGVFIFKYGMIKNFPNALITVFLTLGACFGISWLLQKFLSAKGAKIALLVLLALSLILLVQMIIKFNSGTYAHTGGSFRFGMILLPLLMTYIFSIELWKGSKLKTKNFTQQGQG